MKIENEEKESEEIEIQEMESKEIESKEIEIEYGEEKEQKKKKRRGTFREYFELIVETAIFVFFVMTFVAQASQIPTPSMQNTLLVGDFLLVNKLAYATPVFPFEKAILPRKDIEKNDIVVFKSTEDPSMDIVKRVIGVEGDKIEIKNKQVYVNDEPLDENYKIHTDSRIYSKNERYNSEYYVRDNFGPISVPKGLCFVMGDNRDQSYDSRFWGFLPLNLIKGKPWVIYFSYSAEEDAYLKNNIRDKLKKLVQYFPKARWKRLLSIIK